jgi:hypothetical protein
MGFDLIIAMVRGQQVQTAVLAAPAIKQPIARDSRSFLHTACRLLSRPDEDFVAYCLLRQPSAKLPDFGAALGPEPVIHRQRADFAAPLAHPTVRQKGKRQAVGTAGHGDGDERVRFEARERGDRGAEFGKG